MKTLRTLLANPKTKLEDVKKFFEALPRNIQDFDPSNDAAIVWSTEDVLEAARQDAKRITKKKAFEVLQEVVKNHDASIGVCFESFTGYIDFQNFQHLFKKQA